MVLGLSFSPHEGLFVGCLSNFTTSWLARVSPEKAPFHDLASEDIQHHFHPILFVKSKSVSLDCISGERELGFWMLGKASALSLSLCQYYTVLITCLAICFEIRQYESCNLVLPLFFWFP